MTIWQNIGKGIAGIGLLIGSLFGYHAPVQAPANALGTTIYKPVPRYESSLALALDAVTTSSMTMVSGIDGNGQALSGPMCFTLDSGVANKVEDLCGIASGTVVTNLIRGTDTSGFNASTTLARAHRVGADVKTTDSPYLAQFYGFLNGAQGFPNPLIYDPSITNASITANNQNLVTYGLLASTSVAGAVNGDTTHKGIYQEATAAQVASGTAVGSTGADLTLSTRVASTTGNHATTSIVATLTDGTISPTFISPTSTYAVGGLTSGSTTLNGTTIVNGTTTFNVPPSFNTLQIGTSSALSPNAPQVASGTVLAFFASTGATTTWTVPAGITKVTFFAAGSYTGDAANGLGGTASGTLTVTPGQQFTIAVGGLPAGNVGGFNGGGTTPNSGNNGTGGGGMTDVQVFNSACSTSTIIIAAAGGGGNGYPLGTNGKGGHGGGATGNSGTNGGGVGGGGGSQSSGGSSSASVGTACQGGAGSNSGSNLGGGGGGGGYFGGGGGSLSGATNGGGGGGGGSSFGTSTLVGYTTAIGTNATSGWLYIINAAGASYTIPTSTLAVGGVFQTGGLPLSLSSCGGSVNTTVATLGLVATSTGNQNAGVIQIGTPVSACTATFGQAFAASVFTGVSCTANTLNGSAIALGVNSSLTGFTINAASTLATSTKINYTCLPY